MASPNIYKVFRFISLTGIWRLVCGVQFRRGCCCGTLVAPVALFAGIVAVPRVDGGVQDALGILPGNGCAVYLRGFAVAVADTGIVTVAPSI